MKKIIIFIFFAAQVCSGFSQNANCGKEGTPTSTDWTQYNSNDRNYPNNWNWTIPGVVHPVYLNDNLNNPSFSIQLPYFCGLPAGSGGCGNQNTLQYEILENAGVKQDIFPADGWELLVKNFGTGNVNGNNGRGVPNPYFILYNRYNGKMKIYYAIVGTRTANSGYLQIFFEDKSTKRATFAHIEPIAQTLQEFHPRNNFKVLNDFAQMTTPISYYWLTGEIQTAYDPCTCTDKTLTTQPIVVVRPYLATVTTIDASIEGQIVQKLADNGQVKGEGNGKTSFLDIAKGAANAGIKSYTQFDGFRQQVDKYFDGKNSSYKEKIVRSWWDKNGGGDNIPLNQIEGKFKTFMTYDDNAKKLFGIENLEKYDKTYGTIKQLAGVVPYVGTAISVIDYLISGGQQAPVKPAPPMVFDVNLKLNGELVTPIGQPQISFDMPGSTPSNNNSLNSFYNRTLGVFNILKAPAMEFFELKPAVVDIFNRIVDSRNDCLVSSDRFGEGFHRAKTQSARQFRLKEDVKYVINPNAGLDVDMIDACFVLEYKGNQNLFLNNPMIFDTTAAIPMHSQINLVRNGNGIITLADRIKDIEESGWDLEYMSNDYPSGSNSFIRFRTKYMPLQCLKNMNFILWGGKAPILYLKMLVKTKRKDLPNAEGVNNILTYDISNSIGSNVSKNPIEGTIAHSVFARDVQNIDVWFTCGNISSHIVKFDEFEYNSQIFDIRSLPVANPYYVYPSSLYPTITNDFGRSFTGLSGNFNLSGDVIIGGRNVITTIANNVTIKTLGKIILLKNVVIGSNVTLIAGKSVDIDPSVQIALGTTILTQPSNPTDVFGCNNPNITGLQATNDEVYGAINGICQSKKYLDSTKLLTIRESDFKDSTKSVRLKNSGKEFKVTLDCVPNPFSNFFTINYDLSDDEVINITLSNSFGQIVKTLMSEKVEGGSHQLHVSTEDLTSGMYFITLRTQNGSETKKIMKL